MRKPRGVRVGQGALIALLALLALASFQAPEVKSELATPSAHPVATNAADLACFSDGVTCSHSVDCCSGGCVNGQCGARSKLKRRLARR